MNITYTIEKLYLMDKEVNTVNSVFVSGWLACNLEPVRLYAIIEIVDSLLLRNPPLSQAPKYQE